MAAKKCSNWLDFYSKYGKEDPVGIKTFFRKLSCLDVDCLSLTGNTTAFFNRIEENLMANAVLVPATAKGVLNVVHYCFWDDLATGVGGEQSWESTACTSPPPGNRSSGTEP
jgi:hypothetical protein